MTRAAEGRVQGRAWCPSRSNTLALAATSKKTRDQRPSTRVSAARCQHTDIRFTLCGVPYCPICRQQDRDQISAMFPKVRGDE